MPVPVEDILFADGPLNSVTTIHNGVGWPADAQNDPFTPPISRVAMMIRNPHTLPEVTIMATEPDDGTVPAEDLDFATSEEGDSVATKVGTVGWPAGAENEQGVLPDGTKADAANEDATPDA